MAKVNPICVVSDFKRGLTMVGLARKYGVTVGEIERIIRRYMRATR